MPSHLGQSAVRPLAAAVLVLLGLGLIELGVLALHRGSVRGELGSSSTISPGALPALICNSLDCSSEPAGTSSKPAAAPATGTLSPAGPVVRVAASHPLAEAVVTPTGSQSSVHPPSESVGTGDRHLRTSQASHKNDGRNANNQLQQNQKSKRNHSSSKQRGYEASSGRIRSES